jgi:hypothetical protein
MKSGEDKRIPATPHESMTPTNRYHQGLPPTRAAMVPSAAQRYASLSLMEPSFLTTLTAPGPRIDSLTL